MHVRQSGAVGLTLLLLGVMHTPVPLSAEVKQVVLTHCVDVLDGRPFGDVGAYEKCVGRIVFALDPANSRNRIIVDLDKAPRNADGLVEFTSDLFVLRPKDPSRGNGALFFDFVNRGNKALLSTFNFATGATDPATEAEFGDGFLMEEGYTLLAVGWESNANNPAVRAYLPRASENGRPIVGDYSGWFIPIEPGRVFDLDSQYWTGFRDYRPIDPEDPSYELTVREGFHGEPQAIPRDSWEFGQLVDGQVQFDARHLLLWTGFKPGYTYELTYRAQDPVVAGAGFAAIRDAASYFKYNPASPIRGDYAYATGSSQTGRALRQFIHEGFTIDEDERVAFDGILIRTGGGSLGSFNRRFGIPNEGGFHTETRFPIHYEVTEDSATGAVDGLGVRIPDGMHPKVFMYETSSEYWDRGRVAALNHTSLDGRRDVVLPENVRFYNIGSYPHGGSGFPAPDFFDQQLPGNPIEARPLSRALLTSLDAWVRHGEEPPPSQHGTLADGTLVSQSDIRFPDIPGVHWPYDVPGGYRSDLPGPLTSNPLPFLVPQVDEDGNETSGVLLPEVLVPLGTYTGWAFRSTQVGLPTEILMMRGSYLPFARTRVEREATGDPRQSVEERYASKSDYLNRYESAVRSLISEGYLLERDFVRLMARGADHWDWLMAR